MPRRDYYGGLTLGEAIRRLADHHGEPRTRHLSEDEVELLERAAAVIDEQAPTLQAFSSPAQPAPPPGTGGNSDAMFELGVMANERGDLEEATVWYQRAVELGNASAMVNLGLLVSNQGDDVRAEELYRRAASMGVAVAMANLGSLARQRGDLVEATRWYRLAADSGDPSSMFVLGFMAQERDDPVEATRWYELAATGGNIHVNRPGFVGGS